MNELFISYEEALALKKLGFDEKCFSFFYNKGKGVFRLNEEFMPRKWWTNTWFKKETWETSQYKQKDKEFINNVAAPIYSQAFKWFRKEHGLYHSIVPKLSYPDDHVTGIEWYANIMGGNGVDIGPEGVFDYEEAELACLRKLIQIVKTN